MHQLLTHMNILPPVAVGAKIDILKMLLRCFQLDSRTKNTFREVSGFGVLISVLASLYGSLLDNRKPPWSEGLLCQSFMLGILSKLIQLIEIALVWVMLV